MQPGGSYLGFFTHNSKVAFTRIERPYVNNFS